jgi:hypothetical protein
MWALTALAAYHNAHEKDELGKVDGTKVKVWLGTQFVAELTPEQPSMKFKFDAATDLQTNPQVTLQTVRLIHAFWLAEISRKFQKCSKRKILCIINTFYYHGDADGGY